MYLKILIPCRIEFWKLRLCTTLLFYTIAQLCTICVLLWAGCTFIFHPEVCYFEGKVVHQGWDKKLAFQGTENGRKKILAMINFKEKAQKDVMHILNSMKLSFSGHRVSVFSLRMSSQYYLGLYGKNDNHFSFFNLYHHLMISFTHWKNKLVTYYKNEVTEYEEM